MSGHSKWKNIMHSKGKADAARARLFARLTREIMVVARDGSNPDTNLRLKILIAKAKENNMPGDNIQRAIQRGSGQLDGVMYEELVYEGYAPGGVAIMIDALTDNRNRTAGELRHIFDKYGGNLGENGSVAWIFERKGLLAIEVAEWGRYEDKVLEISLEAGAEDMRVGEDVMEIITAPEDFEAVEQALLAGGFTFVMHEITQVAKNLIHIADADEVARVDRLLQMLDSCDDVQRVYDNMDPEDK